MKTLLGLLMLGATSCATTAATPPATKLPTAGDFYPLGIGTTWQYEVVLLSQKSAFTVKMLREVDGYVEDSTGARFKVDAFGVRDEKRYLLRNPIEAGTKWNNVVAAGSTEHYEIIGSQQPCEAPAGRWEGCVIVESRNREKEGVFLLLEWTFAPGVGLVHLATTIENQGQRIPQSTMVLTSFAPSQPPATTSPR